MSLNKKSLTQKTIDILSNLDMPPVPPNENSFFQERAVYRDEIGIGMRGKVVDIFDEVIELISKEADYEAVSLAKIEDEYYQLLINLLKQYGRSPTNGQAKYELDSCLKRLSESVEERRVLIPIESFRLKDIQELTIGKVRFIEFGKIQEQLKSDFYKLVDNNTFYTLEQKPLIKDNFEARYLKNFLDKVTADITVRAEKGESYNKALYELENAINLLRCYTQLIFSSSSKVKIGIAGTIIKRTHISYLSIKTGGEFSAKGSLAGSLEPYELNPTLLKHLKDKCYLDQFGDILSKDKSLRTELENRIVTAIRWIGSGINEEVDCDKFLKLAIALECLLLRRDEEEGKGSPIAERCAFLLTDDHKKRLDLDGDVKKLYGKRSDIAHEGETEIEKGQLAYMQRIVISCLLKICPKTSEWKNMQDLVDWAKEQRYGPKTKD